MAAYNATCNPQLECLGHALERGFSLPGWDEEERETQGFSFSNIIYTELLVNVCNFVIVALRNDTKKRKPIEQLQIDLAI